MMQAAPQRWRDHKPPGSIESRLACGVHGTGSPLPLDLQQHLQHREYQGRSEPPGFENAVRKQSKLIVVERFKFSAHHENRARSECGSSAVGGLNAIS